MNEVRALLDMLEAVGLVDAFHLFLVQNKHLHWEEAAKEFAKLYPTLFVWHSSERPLPKEIIDYYDRLLFGKN